MKPYLNEGRHTNATLAEQEKAASLQVTVASYNQWLHIINAKPGTQHWQSHSTGLHDNDIKARNNNQYDIWPHITECQKPGLATIWAKKASTISQGSHKVVTTHLTCDEIFNND